MDVGDDGGPHGIATLLAPCAAPSCSSWSGGCGAVLLWPRRCRPRPRLPAHAVFTAAQIDRAQDYRGRLYPLLIARWRRRCRGRARGAVRPERLARLRRPFAGGPDHRRRAGLAGALPFAVRRPPPRGRRGAGSGRATGGGRWSRCWRWRWSLLVAVGTCCGRGGPAGGAAGRRGRRSRSPPSPSPPCSPLFSSRIPCAAPLPGRGSPASSRRWGRTRRSVIVGRTCGTTRGERRDDGLGPTVRVTLDQTLRALDTRRGAQRCSRHELGHVQHHHMLKGLRAGSRCSACPPGAGILRVVGSGWGM